MSVVMSASRSGSAAVRGALTGLTGTLSMFIAVIAAMVYAPVLLVVFAVLSYGALTWRHHTPRAHSGADSPADSHRGPHAAAGVPSHAVGAGAP